MKKNLSYVAGLAALLSLGMTLAACESPTDGESPGTEPSATPSDSPSPGPSPSASPTPTCDAPPANPFGTEAIYPGQALHVTTLSNGTLAIPYQITGGGWVVSTLPRGAKSWTQSLYAATTDFAETVGGNPLVGELDGTALAFISGALKGDTISVYAYAQRTDGSFGAPEKVDGGLTVELTSVASDAVHKVIGLAGISLSGPSQIILYEKVAGGTWTRSLLPTTIAGTPVANGYNADGTAWLAYYSSTGSKDLVLVSRVGSSWTQKGVIAPGPIDFTNNVTITAAPAGTQPEFMAMWATFSTTPQTNTVHAVTFNLSTGKAGSPVLIDSGIPVFATNIVSASFAYTASGAAGIYAIFDGNSQSVLLGSYADGTFSVPQAYVPADSYQNGQNGPGLWINACDNSPFLMSASKVTASSDGFVPFFTELTLADFGATSLQ